VQPDDVSPVLDFREYLTACPRGEIPRELSFATRRVEAPQVFVNNRVHIIHQREGEDLVRYVVDELFALVANLVVDALVLCLNVSERFSMVTSLPT
jgi:hypothetical protein